MKMKMIAAVLVLTTVSFAQYTLVTNGSTNPTQVSDETAFRVVLAWLIQSPSPATLQQRVALIGFTSGGHLYVRGVAGAVHDRLQR
jgi:hypothetical protein